MQSLGKKKGSAGFTLIEMAIVLVVIGLIIGAVLKGQDLIANSRSKKFSTFLRQSETAQWAYFDRNGRFANSTPYLSEVSTFTNQTVLGSSTYFLTVGATGGKDCVALTKSITGTPPLFTADELGYARSFDSAIDNTVTPTTGRVFAASAIGFNHCGLIPRSSLRLLLV